MIYSFTEGLYTLACDECGEEVDSKFGNLHSVVAWKKDKSNLWISKKINGEWKELCPKCNGLNKKKIMSVVKGSFKDDDYIVSYDIDEEKIDLILLKLLSYYKVNGYNGDSICQNDEAIIEAPYILADIADNIIKFKIEDTSEE